MNDMQAHAAKRYAEALERYEPTTKLGGWTKTQWKWVIAKLNIMLDVDEYFLSFDDVARGMLCFSEKKESYWGKKNHLCNKIQCAWKIAGAPEPPL